MIHSLGVVTTTSGIRVRLTNGQASPPQRYACHGFLVQVMETNTDVVRIYDSQTGNRLVCVLPAPTTNSIPAFSANVANSVASFDLSQIWVDVAVSDEGVVVSAVQV